MFGYGITVCQVQQGYKPLQGVQLRCKPVHTFADEVTAEGFIEANSERVVRLTAMGRVLYEQRIPATMPNLVAVHLVR